MSTGGELDPDEEERRYVDLVAAEAASHHSGDRLAVESHKLLVALSTAMSSLDALASPHTKDDERPEMLRIVRRQLAFMDSRLRELAHGLPTGSLGEPSDQRDR